MEKRNIYKIQMHMKDGRYIEIRFSNAMDFGNFLSTLNHNPDILNAKITASGFWDGKETISEQNEEQQMYILTGKLGNYIEMSYFYELTETVKHCINQYKKYGYTIYLKYSNLQ